MKTVLQVGDTHLDYRQFQLTQRQQDYYNVLMQVADIAIEREVDIVCHTGDLYQTARPGCTSIGVTLKWKNKLRKAGIEVVAIPGNHDMSTPNEWIDILGFHNLCRKPYEITSGALMVGLRYTSQEDVVKWLETLPRDTLYAVLHQTFHEIAPHPSATDFTWEDVPPNIICLCGHVHNQYIHTSSNQSTVCYTGNTDFWRLGENPTKYVSIWSGAGQEFIELNTRPVIDFLLEGDEADLLDAVKSASMMPIVILRYKAGEGKYVDALIKDLQSKVLFLRKVPQKEHRTPIKHTEHVSILPMQFIDKCDLLPAGSPQNKLAKLLLEPADSVESTLVGFREQFLGKNIKEVL